jgi:hypothetical protein
VIPGIVSNRGREDTGHDGVSKYTSGSRDQVFGTVDRYGLPAKRRAYAYTKSIVEAKSATTWWVAIHSTYVPHENYGTFSTKFQGQKGCLHIPQ